MAGRPELISRLIRPLLIGLTVSVVFGCWAAQGWSGASPPGVSLSVGPEQALAAPQGTNTLADEHTTIFPPGALGANAQFVFFAASRTAQFARMTDGSSGAVVLQATLNSGGMWGKLDFIPQYGNREVLWSRSAFMVCPGRYDPTFDLNYAAPGSVVQDPTLPPGNLIMIYEAENHCAGGAHRFPFYATVGVARSSDYGRTWPAPVEGELGDASRYPVLKVPLPQPATQPLDANVGDALPSAFVDAADAAGGRYIYVTYNYIPGPPGLTGPDGTSNPRTDGRLRVARARLGGDGRLGFQKWHQGAFAQPGIGGLDSAVITTPSGWLQGCPGFQRGWQTMGEISYNDALKSYLMLFVCGSLDQQNNWIEAAWYFSTATTLALQDWSTPKMVEGSRGPAGAKGETASVETCGPQSLGGVAFNGWYPSLMSPGAAAGHTSRTGFVFYMQGCNGGLPRLFKARPFEIAMPK